jgi:hypothetical protein
MKNVVMTLLVLSATPAFAGKMKDILIMTEESVMDVLGFDESVIRIEDAQFVKVDGVDLAVKSIARSYYSRSESPASFECLTTFRKSGESFSVINTKCVETP